MTDDNTIQFARNAKSKADFFDFIASTFYAQNCAHCRSIQGIALVAVFVGIFSTSLAMVGSLDLYANGHSAWVGYFGGMFLGLVISIGGWLAFFALWKAVTNRIAEDNPAPKPEQINLDDYEIPEAARVDADPSRH